MTLSALLLIPLLGGAAAWLAGRARDAASRWVALGAALADLLAVAWLWSGGAPAAGAPGAWIAAERAAWIPQLGIEYHLAADGLSVLLLALSGFIGVVAVLVSWREIRDHVGAFHAVLLWTLAGINGVFLAVDLVLFYLFWEVMLVPMYFLIGVWGHERRIYAAVKFFIFTLTAGLLMLASIVGIYYIHGRLTGTYTFDYTRLLGTQIGFPAQMWLMLGFLIAFGVKLPAVPVHNWLPDAHSQAPTAGSVILAALLLKTGAYGMIRFAVPLFPEAARAFAPAAMLLGVIGIGYGAILAFAQTDLKRLVAYTSISHMGFVLLGVFVWNELALQGTILQMLAHGVSTGALFIVAGMLHERLHTRDIDSMGGLWSRLPRMGGVAMVFAMASLGLPGLGNFVGEMLILFGAFEASVTLTVLAALGMVLATIYSLWIIQKVFHGPPAVRESLPDLAPREFATLGVLIAAILWLGLFPQRVLDTTRTALEELRPAVSERAAESDAPAIEVGAGSRARAAAAGDATAASIESAEIEP